VSGFTPGTLSRKGFALAIVGALIGSLSTLNGVLIWIAFLPGALYAGTRKAVVWIGCGVVVWVLYFQRFPHSPTRPSIRADLDYSFTYLGGPVGYPHVALALFAGVLSTWLLLGNVAVYWWRHRNFWQIAPWLQLALFVLGCTQATAQGRLFSGPLQVLSSRYQTFSVLWWIALVVIMGLNIQELAADRHLPDWRALAARLGTMGVNLAALILITAGLIPVNVTGLQQALVWQDTQRQYQLAIRGYRTASDSCLELYFPWPNMLRPRVQFLEQQRLSVFSATERPEHVVYSPAVTCQKPYHQFMDNAVPVRPGRWARTSALA
jgi:hypothetical protein